MSPAIVEIWRWFSQISYAALKVAPVRKHAGSFQSLECFSPPSERLKPLPVYKKTLKKIAARWQFPLLTFLSI